MTDDEIRQWLGEHRHLSRRRKPLDRARAKTVVAEEDARMRESQIKDS